MPASCRQIEEINPVHVTRAAWQTLREALIRDGIESEIKEFDITVDVDYRSAIHIIRVSIYNRFVAEYYCEGIDHYMSDEALNTSIRSAMSANLHLAAQLHHARLAQRFPHRIETVVIEINPDRDTKMVTVKFKNGHVATCDEIEARGDLFMARCMMLYDLPPI